MASFSRAGVWGSQPDIGLVGDYYSNPALISLPNTAESHADVLIDAPTGYQGDAYKLTIIPSFRFSDTQGYSYLDSDYEHLNVANQFFNARGSVTLTAAADRDSSLYHDYLLDGSTGVRRDTLLGDLNWDRQLTERTELDLDGNWTKVNFGSASSGISTLVDYKYTSFAPTFAWQQSERGKLTLGASVGRYNSTNGETESTSENVQAGFVEQLSEIWSVTASAGYSRATNRADLVEYIEIFPGFYLPVPLVLKTTQNGSVYAVTLTRQTPVCTLVATASRQLMPTGFAFLSRQESYELKASYHTSERWTFSADVHRLDYQQPQELTTSVETTSASVTSYSATAAWNWTEHWTLTLSAMRIEERYGAPARGIDSSGVSVEISRQFDWKSFQ